MSALKCDICGGNLIMDISGDFALCECCGMKHSKERVRTLAQTNTGTVKIDVADSLKNYLEIMKASSEVSNYEETEKYANKVIEIDTTNYEAWLYKGKAAGWQSTVSNNRFPEAVNCWTFALKYARDDIKEELKTEINAEMERILVAILTLRTERFEAYPDEEEAEGFINDVNIIQSALTSFNEKSGLNIDIDRITSVIAQMMNVYTVKAYEDKILPEYQGSENKPDDYDFQLFLDRINCCTLIIKHAIGINGNDVKQDVTCYENLIFLNEKAMASCAWDYDFNGFLQSKRYFVSSELTDEAKAARRELINEYREKINEIDPDRTTEQTQKESEPAETESTDNGSDKGHTEDKETLKLKKRDAENRLQSLGIFAIREKKELTKLINDIDMELAKQN